MPIWGSCQGLLDMAISSSTDKNLISKDYETREQTSLHFTQNPEMTKLFGPMGKHSQNFTQNDITYNDQIYGLHPDKFQTDKQLASMFTATAYSYDKLNQPFVSAMESKNYPFFGVSFHPEKPGQSSD